MYWRCGRFDDAISAGHRTLDFGPKLVNVQWWLGLAFAGKRQFDKALACLRRAEELDPGPMTLGYHGHVLGLAGERAQALDRLRRLDALSATRYVPPGNFAAIHAGLGERDATFEWMGTALQRRNHCTHELRSPLYDGLRSDSRYAKLLKLSGIG